MWQNDHQLLGIMSTVWIVWDPGDNSPSAHVVNFRAHALCPCFMKVSGRNSMWTVWITLKIPQHRKPSACASSHHLISRTCKTCLSSSKAVRCQHNPQASLGNRSRITSGALGCEFSSAEHHCDCMFLEKRWAVSKVTQSEQEWTRDLLYNQLLEETHSIKHCCMCIYIYLLIIPALKSSTLTLCIAPLRISSLLRRNLLAQAPVGLPVPHSMLRLTNRNLSGTALSRQYIYANWCLPDHSQLLLFHAFSYIVLWGVIMDI